MKRQGVWVEVTTLLIPSLNDNMSELKDLARFIRTEMGPETPWHVSRFYPQYHVVDIPPTDAQVLRQVRQLGLDEGLYYVYTGNLPWDPGEKTHCPGCSQLLIHRSGYTIVRNTVKDGLCPKCGYKVEGLAW